MAESAASTAYGPMVIAAMEHTLPEPQRILDDPLAYRMLPPGMRLITKALLPRPLRQMFVNAMEKSTPGIYNGMVCRKRFVEDKVIEMLNTGLDSVVILGAGMDTLAYRVERLASTRVYEIDLPVNIEVKAKQLRALYGAIPAYVSLAPLDFESQTLESALTQAGYSFEWRTFFVWEGVTQYLTEDAVRDTLRFLAKTRPGSRLAFTYIVRDFIDGKNMYASARLYQRFRVQDQIWRFGIDRDGVGTLLGEYGWKMIEQVDAAEFTRRYVQPAGRTGAVMEIEPSVLAEKLP